MFATDWDCGEYFVYQHKFFFIPVFINNVRNTTGHHGTDFINYSKKGVQEISASALSELLVMS